MSGIPEIPKPEPKVPPVLFWISLVAPPAIIYFVTLAARFMMDVKLEERFILSLLIVPFVFSVTAVFLMIFYHAVGKRYRGLSLEFLCATFFLGQIIVCLMIWLCFCLPIIWKF
jgi:hypothetical protein